LELEVEGDVILFRHSGQRKKEQRFNAPFEAQGKESTEGTERAGEFRLWVADTAGRGFGGHRQECLCYLKHGWSRTSMLRVSESKGVDSIAVVWILTELGFL
jgi:hypothetical protein